MRSVFQWSIGARALELGKRTLIMGIVNVTPDSFSDGGQFLDRDQAVAHAERLLEEGADILDIGGESTWPGARVDADVSKPAEEKKGLAGNLKVSAVGVSASAVSVEEELKRVLPVIAELKKKYPAAVLSVDTYKAEIGESQGECSGGECIGSQRGRRTQARAAGHRRVEEEVSRCCTLRRYLQSGRRPRGRRRRSGDRE